MGVDLSIPPVAPADVPAIPAQELGHLPAVLLGKLPAVLKRAYPAGDVYLRWLLHRAWQDACHLDNYLRCYRLHGGCRFEYTSGGSCGRACIIPPKIWGHLPPVGQRCLPAVLWVVYLRSSVLAGRCLPAVLTSTCGAMGCLPPVGSPTLGESKFEYTSGGSCGRACNVPPIDWDIYLRCKNISYRARYRPLAKSERKTQGRKGHIKTAEVRGANGD